MLKMVYMMMISFFKMRPLVVIILKTTPVMTKPCMCPSSPVARQPALRSTQKAEADLVQPDSDGIIGRIIIVIVKRSMVKAAYSAKAAQQFTIPDAVTVAVNIGPMQPQAAIIRIVVIITAVHPIHISAHI